MDKSNFKNVSLDDALLKFLFSYRISPHSTTGFFPAELMFSRKLRFRLDFVFSDSSRESMRSRVRNCTRRRKTDRYFNVGDLVYVDSFGQNKWIEGTALQTSIYVDK